MTAQPGAGSVKLYTPRLLGLSAQLAGFPFVGEFQHSADARSRTCGSTITVGLDLGEEGAVTRIGMQVTACAVGQSSAAVLAQDAQGRTAKCFAAMLAKIEAWLTDEGPLPGWPGFDALEPALPHKGRHDALLLPWKAVSEALSSVEPAR
jgi:NifU-like protein involved in Fe-S cluster formation